MGRAPSHFGLRLVVGNFQTIKGLTSADNRIVVVAVVRVVPVVLIPHPGFQPIMPRDYWPSLNSGRIGTDEVQHMGTHPTNRRWNGRPTPMRPTATAYALLAALFLAALPDGCASDSQSHAKSTSTAAEPATTRPAPVAAK
jgi:hypothetical protein